MIEEIPEGYRKTEIGILPEDWKVMRLEKILYPDRKKLKHTQYDGSIPLVEKIQFNTGEIVFRKKRHTKTDLYVGKKGRLLISKINFHQGAVAIIDTNIIAATTHYEIYRIDNTHADLRFLWYYFRSISFKEIFYNEIKFAGIKKEANYKFIKTLKISLPPLEEQKKTTKILDTIRQAIEIQDNLIKTWKKIKKAVMEKVFREGLHGEELKKTEIGEIPKGWEVVRLGEVAEIKIGRTPERKRKEYWENGTIPWVKIQDLNNGLIFTTDEKITEKAFIEIFKGNFTPKGTLLMSFKLTIGRVGILGIDAVHHEGIASLFINQNRVENKFLFYLLQTLDFSGNSDSYVKGKTLNKKKLISLKLPLPPLKEQKEIAQILLTIDKKIEIEQRKKEVLQKLFKSMLHLLMTGKIRVKEVKI